MQLKDQLEDAGRSILEIPRAKIPVRGTENFGDLVSGTPSLKRKQQDLQTAPKIKKQKATPSPKKVGSKASTPIDDAVRRMRADAMEKSPKRKKSSPIGKNLAAAIAAVPLTDAQAKCFKIGTKTEVFEEGAWHPAIVTEHVSGQGAHGVRKLNYQVAKWKGWTLRIDLDDEEDRCTIRLRPQIV